MYAIKPAELTLAIQKATEGFTVIVDSPMDNDLIKILQLLVPVLMKTTYDELTLQHNLSGVILPVKRYEQIYKNGAYAIPLSSHSTITTLMKMPQGWKSIAPKENTKRDVTTGRCTKQPTMPVAPSS